MRRFSSFLINEQSLLFTIIPHFIDKMLSLFPELHREILERIRWTTYNIDSRDLVDDFSLVSLGCTCWSLWKLVKDYYTGKRPLKLGDISKTIGFYRSIVLDFVVNNEWMIDPVLLLMTSTISDNTDLVEQINSIVDADGMLLAITYKNLIFNLSKPTIANMVCLTITSKKMVSLLNDRSLLNTPNYLLSSSIRIFEGTPYLGEERVDDYVFSNPSDTLIEDFIVTALLKRRFDILNIYSNNSKAKFVHIMTKNRRFILEEFLMGFDAMHGVFIFIHKISPITIYELDIICQCINESGRARQIPIILDLFEIFGKANVIAKIDGREILSTMKNRIRYTQIYYPSIDFRFDREVEFLCFLYKEGVFDETLDFSILLHHLINHIYLHCVKHTLCCLKPKHSAIMIGYVDRLIVLENEVNQMDCKVDSPFPDQGSVIAWRIISDILACLGGGEIRYDERPNPEDLRYFLFSYAELVEIPSITKYIYQNYKELPRGFWKCLLNTDLKPEYKKTITDYLL
jgi:hypothetical protein